MASDISTSLCQSDGYCRAKTGRCSGYQSYLAFEFEFVQYH
jgi:hypothetical protein